LRGSRCPAAIKSKASSAYDAACFRRVATIMIGEKAAAMIAEDA
jgi:hypothetical protein